jgi:hypothetical protein
MDTTDLEAKRENSEAVAENQEEAAVETIGALEDRYWDRHLALGRRRQPKKLAAARRWMSVRANSARRNGRSHEGQTAEKK